jgi:hypothetical protein
MEIQISMIQQNTFQDTLLCTCGDIVRWRDRLRHSPVLQDVD